MKTIKLIALSMLSSAAFSVTCHAEDCSDVANYAHCLHSNTPVDNVHKKWMIMEAAGQSFGPVCAPQNSVSYIPQKRAAQFAGQTLTWVMKQCNNQACANPIVVVSDTFTVKQDPATKLYTSTPLNTIYQNNPQYGDDCTQSAELGAEFLKAK